MGQGLESGVKKNALRLETTNPFGCLFQAFRQFPALDFSFIFEVTSDSELFALWWPKGAQKEVFGEPFRIDFDLSGESENEAPV